MNPIRLKLAQEEFDAGGGFEFTFAPISAKVQNLGFAKDVSVHYTPDNVTWKDDPLAWTAPSFGDYDLFTGTVNEQVEQFVIRYDVNGQTFWDNNDGQNYNFISNLATVGGNVVLNKATARQGSEAGGGFVFTTSWLEGEILVNNFGFSKSVGIVITVDGGVNWTATQATFSGNNTADGKFVGPAEVWTFKTPEFNLNPASDEFFFAAFYQDLASSREFWDNNFGQNYQLSKTNGAVLA
jgi:Carbohydrate/starch-binding module (family 21)